MILSPPLWATGSWVDDSWADGTWATEVTIPTGASYVELDAVYAPETSLGGLYAPSVTLHGVVKVE